MRIAHVRERHAPAGAPWRLAAAPSERPRTARAAGSTSRRPVAGPSRRPGAGARRGPPPPADHDARRPPRARAAGRGAARPRRGLRCRAEDDDPAILDAADLAFGPPVLRPPSLRDFYAFEGHVRTMWERRGGEVPEAWYRLPIFYFSNVSEIRGPDEPGLVAGRRRASSTTSWRSRPLVDTPALRPRRRTGRGGDRRLHDLQRLVGARPPARRDGRPARPGQGQGLRQLVRAVAGDARRARRRARRGPATTWR